MIDAGARFVVGPVFRPDVIAACHERDVPAMPGCFSPTEILAAHECGADIVKVFPATMLGPQFLKDVRAPLPQVKLMPTGGVTLDNAGDWIRAGAVAVGSDRRCSTRRRSTAAASTSSPRMRAGGRNIAAARLPRSGGGHSRWGEHPRLGLRGLIDCQMFYLNDAARRVAAARCGLRTT